MFAFRKSSTENQAAGKKKEEVSNNQAYGLSRVLVIVREEVQHNNLQGNKLC